MNITELNKAIGNIDLFLLDQVLKGRYLENECILDAGCGEGRNIIYFLQHNFEVYGIDTNPDAIQMLQFIARSNGKSSEKFCVGDLIALPYPDVFFDHVIANAVLHFANDDQHFDAMLSELIRVLKPSGSLFINMSSSIGEHKAPTRIKAETHYFLTESRLEKIVAQYALSLIEPVKTLNEGYQKHRTILMLSKSGI